jgi:hypothetical protein
VSWYVIGALGAAAFVWLVCKLAGTERSAGRTEAMAERAAADTKAVTGVAKKFANKASSPLANAIKLRRWAKNLPERNP